MKNVKSPKSTIDTAINTSSEILKRIPDLPELMDRADYALKLMADGNLNLGLGTSQPINTPSKKYPITIPQSFHHLVC